MKVHKLPLPDPNSGYAMDFIFPIVCENCQMLPARIRLVIGSSYSEKLCVACIGVMSMEISAVLEQLKGEIQ